MSVKWKKTKGCKSERKNGRKAKIEHEKTDYCRKGRMSLPEVEKQFEDGHADVS